MTENLQAYGVQSRQAVFVRYCLKGLAFFGLLEDVVNALGKDVDMLDTTQIIPDSEVDEEILQTGVLIYG